MSATPSELTGNRRIAARLAEFAQLLEALGGDRFRISAYRRAARSILRLDRPIADLIASGGRRALEAIPGVGHSIAAALEEMATSGRWRQLDRLRGDAEPERLLETIPGIGELLADRIADALDIDSLEDLEIALVDGRLERLAGIGPRRLTMIRQALAERLGALPWPKRHGRAPSSRTLLEIDRIYREAARAGALHKVAPRRFNPERRPWLPVLHCRRGPWLFTALFSNTARAHGLGRVGDWVIVHWEDRRGNDGQCTVVTERSGPRAGQRVVRGAPPRRLAQCDTPPPAAVAAPAA